MAAWLSSTPMTASAPRSLAKMRSVSTRTLAGTTERTMMSMASGNLAKHRKRKAVWLNVSNVAAIVNWQRTTRLCWAPVPVPVAAGGNEGVDDGINKAGGGGKARDMGGDKGRGGKNVGGKGGVSKGGVRKGASEVGGGGAVGGAEGGRNGGGAVGGGGIR